MKVTKQKLRMLMLTEIFNIVKKVIIPLLEPY